tara:strand:+ start:470 stop:898 length:429 start_codon:yes stop_codon:yes gene_type:complete
MEINTKIIEIEEKVAKNGRRYHRVKTNEGWLSVFEKDIVESLRDYVGGMCNIAIAERGDFKNIIGLVDQGIRVDSKLEQIKQEEQPKPKQSQNDDKPSFYVSYAKDLFIALISRPNNNTFDAELEMKLAIDLVKQARESFKQ